jgi:hypothetical protein
MDRDFPESDWKLFRQVRTLALDRFCQRVLAEVNKLATSADKSNHERYLQVFRLLEKRDRELADTFDEPKRSTALLRLLQLRFHNLLTEEEFARFSPETRGRVQAFIDSTRED